MFNSFTRRFINGLTDVSLTIGSNIYNGVKRAVSAVIPGGVKRRASNFINWATGREEQVIREEEEEDATISRRARTNFELREEMSALRGFAIKQVTDGADGWGPNDFLEGARESITRYLRNHRNIKVKLALFCEFVKAVTKSDEIKRFEGRFESYNKIITIESDVNEVYDKMVQRVMQNFESFLLKESGGVFSRVTRLKLYVAENRPLWEGLASSWLPLPAGLKRKNNKNGLVNIQNKEDHNCFLYCAMRVAYPKETHPERVDKKLREQIKELNMEGIECPVKLRDINKFENQNPSFSVVVIGYDEKDGLYPLRRQGKKLLVGNI